MSTSLASRVRSVSVGGALSQVARLSAGLVGTQAITSVLGFAYWTVAARTVSVAAVGTAGAAVALMTVLSTVGMLGFGTLLISEIPRVGQARRRRLIRTALTVVLLATTALAIAACVVIRLLPPGGLRAIAGSLLIAGSFVVGTALTGVTSVLDQAVLSIGNGLLQLERNTVASVVKIGALVAVVQTGHRSGMAVFLSWTIGTVVSLVLLAVRVRGGRALEQPGGMFDVASVRGLGRQAAGHHVLNLVLQAPFQLLSVLVVFLVSATDNGYFSTVRLVAGFVFVLPYSITIGLFAASANDAAGLVSKMRLTIPFALAASLAAQLVLFPAGGWILAAFGAGYVSAGVTALRVLAAAGTPFVIKDHYVALRRVQGRATAAAVVTGVGAVVELVAAAAGARAGGTVGLCVAWLAVLVVEAVVLAVPLWRAAHDTSGPGGDRTADGGDVPAARDSGVATAVRP